MDGWWMAEQMQARSTDWWAKWTSCNPTHRAISWPGHCMWIMCNNNNERWANLEWNDGARGTKHPCVQIRLKVGRMSDVFSFKVCHILFWDEVTAALFPRQYGPLFPRSAKIVIGDGGKRGSNVCNSILSHTKHFFSFFLPSFLMYRDVYLMEVHWERRTTGRKHFVIRG